MKKLKQKKNLTNGPGLISVLSILGLLALVGMQELEMHAPLPKPQTTSSASAIEPNGGRVPNSYRQEIKRLHRFQFHEDLVENHLPQE